MIKFNWKLCKNLFFLIINLYRENFLSIKLYIGGHYLEIKYKIVVDEIFPISF